MARPIKITQFKPGHEDAAVYMRRAWAGPTIVLGHTPAHVIRMDFPDRATVPLGANLGPLSREAGAVTLRNAAPFAADVFVVQVLSPSGEARYGMVAVPQASTPTFGSW